VVCIARQTNQDRGFVSIKVSTTRTQNLLRRSNTGSPSDQFVTFLLLIHPTGEEMSTSLFCYRSALLFLAHRVESSVSLWGDFSTAFGEGPEQGSAGTMWGSRTSTPSRESFSGALPPFVTDGDGWLGRPRGTLADVRRSQEGGRSHSAVAPVQQLPWPPELASPARSTP